MPPSETPSPIEPVILSGGSGTRLWPESRRHSPKQLLPIVDDRTMLRATIDRADAIGSVNDPVVVCGVDHADAVELELEAAGHRPRLIVEPEGRNTAPAVAAAAMLAPPQTLLLVLPADHVIRDVDAFVAAVEAGMGLASGGALVTFGIVPTKPETGYGYIQAGEPVTDTARRVARFVEKPDAETARRYVDSGEYLWNSGMFLFTAGHFLAELQRHAPDVHAAVAAAVGECRREGGRVYLGPDAFASAPSVSVDVAVMERTDRAVMVPLDAGWSDVGSWAALWEIADKDASGNVVIGDVVAHDVARSYLRATSRLLAVAGVEDTIVVETPDAVLVVPRDRAQDVKAIVDRLKAEERREIDRPRLRRTPWGFIETLLREGPMRVHRLSLRPGAELPETTHPRRVEHWTVIEGVITAEIGGLTRTVPAGEAAVVPKGEIHRLINRSKRRAVVISVEVGDLDADASDEQDPERSA